MRSRALSKAHVGPRRFWQPELIGVVALVALMFLLPTVVGSDYLISKYSRYLVFGILSMALAFSWGYCGILNLGQALPFGLGSYAMAMALKLRTVPVQTGAGGLPDFMVWNNVEKLPWFWAPFYSMPFAIVGRAAGSGAADGRARLVHVPRQDHRRVRGHHDAWRCWWSST